MRNKWFTILALLLLSASVQAQQYITPQQAIQAMRQFTGVPNLRVTVDPQEDYWPNGDGSHFGDNGYFGTHYRLHVPYGVWNGMYYVHATDGAVLSMDIDGLDDRSVDYETAAPVLTQAQAQAIAEQYVRQHFPAANQGQWRLEPDPEGWSSFRALCIYSFVWCPILNAQWGTLGMYHTIVDVEGIHGKVIKYERPRDYAITGPTVPQITQAQAQQLAAPFADYNLMQVPFASPLLQLHEDAFGVQTLEWEFKQFPIPGDTHHYPSAIRINAITGSVNVLRGNLSLGSFGGAGGVSAHKITANLNPRKKEVEPSTSIRVHLPGTSGAVSAVPPVLEHDHVWMRAELLRALGADVQFTAKALTLHVGKRTLTGAQVGAKWRDQGWWVALKVLADKAGWQVTWLPFNKEAVVDTDPAKTAALRQRQPTDHAAPQDTKANGAKADSGQAVATTPETKPLPANK